MMPSLDGPARAISHKVTWYEFRIHAAYQVAVHETAIVWSIRWVPAVFATSFVSVALLRTTWYSDRNQKYGEFSKEVCR